LEEGVEFEGEKGRKMFDEIEKKENDG